MCRARACVSAAVGACLGCGCRCCGCFSLDDDEYDAGCGCGCGEDADDEDDVEDGVDADAAADVVALGVDAVDAVVVAVVAAAAAAAAVDAGFFRRFFRNPHSLKRILYIFGLPKNDQHSDVEKSNNSKGARCLSERDLLCITTYVAKNEYFSSMMATTSSNVLPCRMYSSSMTLLRSAQSLAVAHCFWAVDDRMVATMGAS